MSFMMHMDTDMFIGLIKKALEQDLEDKLWEKWLVELPYFDEETFVPFGKYVDKHLRRQIVAEKTEQEILNDAANILKMTNKS